MSSQIKVRYIAGNHLGMILSTRDIDDNINSWLGVKVQFKVKMEYHLSLIPRLKVCKSMMKSQLFLNRWLYSDGFYLLRFSKLMVFRIFHSSPYYHHVLPLCQMPGCHYLIPLNTYRKFYLWELSEEYI